MLLLDVEHLYKLSPNSALLTMTRLSNKPFAIVVILSSRSKPQRFVWANHFFAIERITDEWRVDCDWWIDGEGRSRHYYAITTTAGSHCVLYCDLMDGTWYLEQVFD